MSEKLLVRHSPLSNCRGLIKRGWLGGPPNTLVISGGDNRLKWKDICETSLNWRVSNRLGGHSNVINCKDYYTMHKLGISLNL